MKEMSKSCFGDDSEQKKTRYIHIFTDNTKVAIESEPCVILQGNNRFVLPEYAEYKLIFLLFRKKNRAEAAKFLRDAFHDMMQVDDALDQFMMKHPQEVETRPVSLMDLEPLADEEKGLGILIENNCVHITANEEKELISLLQSRDLDGLYQWFKEYLKNNVPKLSPYKLPDYAAKLSLCYMNFQCLDIDDTDPFFKQKSTRKRFLSAMAVFVIIIISFLLYLIIKY
ncbi:MAG: hypothetical protein MJY89_08375 [Bacteroidales bacterium]|nr:hypothetical protein [Bacteroidales bacterium]